MVGIAHDSGWLAIVGADSIGRPTSLLITLVSPTGERPGLFHAFEHDGRCLQLSSETIRDVDADDRDITWKAYFFKPAEIDHPNPIWTDAYNDRSVRLKRTSSSRGRHARRVRLDNVSIERFDPHEIFERDKWICQLCHSPVDSNLEWPDPLYPSLDHVLPLAANGQHSRTNTQLAHWICNVRKGAAT